MNSIFIVTLSLLTLLGSGAGFSQTGDVTLPDSRPTDEPGDVQPRQNENIIDRSLIERVETVAPEKTPENGTDADTNPEVDAKPGLTEAVKESTANAWTWAIGTNLSWSFREDYGSRKFRRFEPEIVGYWYMATPVEKLWLRHGARVSYSDAQPQMPKALRVEEYDWKASIEEGLVWSAMLAPSLTAGIGRDWRTIKVKAKPPITSVDPRLNSKDDFLWVYAQAGLGIPLVSGRFLIEPVVRYQHLAHDKRTNWAAGLEMTVAW